MMTYNTLDNNDYAYIVDINKAYIHILDYVTSKMVLKIKDPKAIFIGKSKETNITWSKNTYGKKYDGNTILINTVLDTYIYIGYKIISIEMSNIVTFDSPVGPNGKSYSYAIDTNENYYLFEEDVIIKKLPEKYKDDPYNYFYNNVCMNINEQHFKITIKPKLIIRFKSNVKKPIIKLKVKYIIHFCVGGDLNLYQFRYQPFPDEYYDYLMTKSTDIYMLINNNKTVLTKQMYCNLMKEYGNSMNMEPLNHNLINNSRDF
jgi:hypothetical protein